MSAPRTPAEAPWVFEDANAKRGVDGDTQLYVARRTLQRPEAVLAFPGEQIRFPGESVTAEREFMVRLLETNTPERKDDYDGWLVAKGFAEDLLSMHDPIAMELRLTGRIDPYGRWLGWAIVAGVNLSYALNEAGLGEYREPVLHQAELLEEEA